jgi:hypothetical protein
MIDLFHTSPGDILVIEENEAYTFESEPLKVIICFSHVIEAGTDYYTCAVKFIRRWAGSLEVKDASVRINLSIEHIRKPTPTEMFQLADALRQNGYRYNRKTRKLYEYNRCTNKLTKINS